MNYHEISSTSRTGYLASLSNTFDLVSLQFYFFKCVNIFHNFLVFIC